MLQNGCNPNAPTRTDVKWNVRLSRKVYVTVSQNICAKLSKAIVFFLFLPPAIRRMGEGNSVSLFTFRGGGVPDPALDGWGGGGFQGLRFSGGGGVPGLRFSGGGGVSGLRFFLGGSPRSQIFLGGSQVSDFQGLGGSQVSDFFLGGSQVSDFLGGVQGLRFGGSQVSDFGGGGVPGLRFLGRGATQSQ